MSVREVKAFTLTCEMAYGNGDPSRPPKCTNRNIGPFFAEYESDVPLPEGWGYRTLHGCGGDHYGYTRHDLICGDCAQRLEIEIQR